MGQEGFMFQSLLPSIPFVQDALLMSIPKADTREIKIQYEFAVLVGLCALCLIIIGFFCCIAARLQLVGCQCWV